MPGSPMKQDWKAVGSFGTVGLEMVLSIVIGLFIGRWLDGKLGTEPIFSVLWFFFGVGAAGKAVHRTWKEMQLATAREEREQGNPAPLFDDVKKTKRRTSNDERRAGATAPAGDDKDQLPVAKEHHGR